MEHPDDHADLTEDGRPGPLDGIRVIDLSSVLMGPLATRTLGDLGADVIAVETHEGERNRGMGPGPAPQFSGIALNLMRNKRSIALDLKQKAGRQTFLDLAATCDVMITNLRPGPVGRLGLDYDSITAVRPEIIYCQANGYPSDSDRAEAPAYDDIIQSASGVGDVFRRAGHEPSLMPTLVADKIVGMTIANAVLAALFHRSSSGRGQHIEVPMIDTMRSFILAEHGSGAIAEPPVAEPGYPRILTPERRPRATLDGWINVLPYEEAHYVALFTAGSRPDMETDQRFRTRDGRYDNSDSLYRDVAAILATRTTEDWMAFCAEHGIPAAEARDLDDLIAELPIAEHPVAGKYRIIPPPERFSRTPTSVRRPAPSVGQHGREVLTEIGYDGAAIDRLESDGIIGTTEL